MNALTVFENETFGSVRTLDEEGNVLFCGNDVAKALGYKRPADAIAAHCKESANHRLLTAGGEQSVKFIPEGDVYRLAAKSELPVAALGVSPQKIGRIANENGDKTDKYGEWYHDKARYTDKEVSTFRYNQAGFDFIKNILENA